MKKTLFAMSIIAALVASCKKPENILPQSPAQDEISSSILKDSIYNGHKTTLFGGKAWVWIKLTNGKPNQLAVTLTNKVFETVPFDSSEQENEIVLPAPQQANITAFRDFAIDWSPQGHLPAGIYDQPLFDFHFYTIAETERQAIFTDPDYYQHFRTYPPPEYLPQNYGLVDAGGIPGGGCITGAHWYFLNGPEFNGKKFTQTFVYGTYNGKVDFYDPMMTQQFLKNVQSFERNIPQPTKFTPNGYYPIKLRVAKHDGVTDIIFEGFQLRPAS